MFRRRLDPRRNCGEVQYSLATYCRCMISTLPLESSNSKLQTMPTGRIYREAGVQWKMRSDLNVPQAGRCVSLGLPTSSNEIPGGPASDHRSNPNNLTNRYSWMSATEVTRSGKKCDQRNQPAILKGNRREAGVSQALPVRTTSHGARFLENAHSSGAPIWPPRCFPPSMSNLQKEVRIRI